VLVTAVVVQADLPSDDRAFWRTRPIAPLALAISKLITCGVLLVVVPWLVNAGRLLAYGALPSAIAASAVQLSVLAGSTVVPAWAVAVATRTLARMIAVGLGLVVAGWLSISAFFYWTAVWSVRSGSVGSVGIRMPTVVLDWQGLGPHGWWAALLTTIAALCIIVAHYQYRRRVIAIAAAVVLLIGAWAIPSRDPHPPAPEPLEHLIAGHLDVAGPLTLPPKPMVESSFRSSMPYPVPLSVQLTLPQLPADMSASVFLRRIRLHSGRTVEPRDAWRCCFSGGVIGVVSPALAEPRHDGGFYGSTGQGFEVDLADLDHLRDRMVSIEADGEVRLMQHHVAAAIPLRPGTAVRVGARLIEVLSFEPSRSVFLIRYATFPSVIGPLTDVALLVGNRDRTRVSVTSLGGSTGPSVQDMMQGPRPESAGRQWVARQHVVISDRKVLDEDLLLYVVETREIGTVRSRVAKTGLRSWTPGKGPR